MEKIIILYFILFASSFSVIAQKISYQKENDIAKLINGPHSFELLNKYKQYQDSISPFIRLCAQIDLSQSFNQENKAVKLIDSLLINYSQQLSPETKLGYEIMQAGILLNSGRYRKFYDFVNSKIDDYANAGEHQYIPYFSNFQKQAEWLKDVADFEVIKPDRDCYISIPDDGSLIYVDVKLNNNLINDCLLDTGGGITLFKEESVKHTGIKIFNDTLTLVHGLAGPQKYRLALIDSLRIDDIVVKNLIAGVLCSDQYSIEDRGVIGIQVIKALKKITYTPTKIIIPYTDQQKTNITPNMTFKNGLHIEGIYQKRKVNFYFDTGAYFNNLAENIIDSAGTNSWHEIPVNIGNNVDTLLFWVNSEYNFGVDGLLGTPFLRSYKNVSIDFVNMHIQADSLVGYTPPVKYYSTQDFFGISELVKEHSFYGMEKYLVKIQNSCGLNHPEKTIAYIDTLLNNYYYPLNVEHSSVRSQLLHILYVKATALYDSGKYAQAYEVLKEALNTFSEVGQSLNSMLHQYYSLVNCPPLQIRFINSRKLIHNESQNKEGMEIPMKINGIREKGTINFGSPYCMISEDYVEKLNIDILADSILWNEEKVKLGLMNTLKMGNVIAENIIFFILPEKEKQLSIGQSLLRKIPQIDIIPGKRICFNKDVVQKANPQPFRLLNSSLITQFKLNKIPVVFVINPNPGITFNKQLTTNEQLYFGPIKIDPTFVSLENISSNGIGIQGKIGFADLLQRTKEISFDFRNMQIYIH